MNALSAPQSEIEPGAGPVGAPLYVDVDGTLLTTDLLWESAFALVRQEPLRVWRVPGALVRGKAALKEEFARGAPVDVTTLPTNAAVLEVARQARADGRRVVMATAADRHLAEPLADHLGVFDAVLASDGTTNLSGTAKLAAIRADAARHGGCDAFAYIGDSRADAPLFRAAAAGHVVTRAAAPSFARDATPLPAPRAGLRDVMKAMRVHQWLKNVFLFVPLALMRDEIDAAGFLAALTGFFAFSFIASATYILNDLLDLRADRLHSTKRRRPFAAGRIAIADGLLLAVGCMGLGIAFAALLPFAFQAILALYVATTLSYSFAVKRFLLLDVLSIAGLHTLRILAGAAAIDVSVSYWLLAFSIFFFLSLALVKRFTELLEVGVAASRERTGRGYRYDDLETLATSGICASFSAVLVLALYINAPETLAEVDKPFMLWPVCPLILYALMRIWILARRREMSEDPVWFALTDWRSQVTFALAALTYVVAPYV